MSDSKWDKPGRGTAFQTRGWQPGSNRPQFTGYVVLQEEYKPGDKIYLAAWLRNASNGNPMLSLSEDLQARQYNNKPKQTEDVEVKPAWASKAATFSDDDVPF